MNTETHVPATGSDNPFLAHYATKVVYGNEVMMRADFARSQELRGSVARAASCDDYDRIITAAEAIERRWREHEVYGQAWQYLTDTHTDWVRDPEVMDRFHTGIVIDRARGVDPLTPMQWRSQLQAREMTGNGYWMDSTGQHAFDGLTAGAFAAGTDREGIER
ncbi:hypothetical protein [Nocardia sp. NPDC050435]|uniref:hypothetical protein n=1 Tax=Nocardia sp. NPDC050435 TaxID=3155040 RepID=UPI0033D78603